MPKVGGMGYGLPGELRSSFEEGLAFARAHCAEVASQAEQWVWKVSCDIVGSSLECVSVFAV